MLRNSGPYGPNETPVNRGAAVNISELNNPVNITQNFNNLVKISQHASHSSTSNLNFQNYASYDSSSLGHSSQMNHFHNRQQLDHPTNLTTSNTNLIHNTLRQNALLVERLNFTENSFLNRFNNLRKPATDFPPLHTFVPEVNSKQKFTSEVAGNSHTSSRVGDVNLQFFTNTLSYDNDESKSSLNNRGDSLTDQNINHMTTVIKREIEDSNDCNSFNSHEIQEHNVTGIDSQSVEMKYGYKSNGETLENTAKDYSTSFNNCEDQTQESDPEDAMPLALTRPIKQEPEPVNNIETQVVVKIEKVTSWTDTEHMHPFLKDINGVLREDSSHCNIVDSGTSVSEATDILKMGASTDFYFECPSCCLLFNHPKRFLVHVKWHSFGLHNEKRLEQAQEKVERRRQRNLATNKVDDIAGEDNTLTVNAESGGSKPVPDSKIPGTSKTPEYICRSCDKTFANKTGLRNHRHKFHPNREHECKVCHKVVIGWFGLKSHMVTHSNEAGFQCDKCPKKFKHSHSLAKHKDTHLEKIHQCGQCPKKFGSQNLLKMHMRTHERMQRGPTLSCSYCAKGFYETYTLQVHERTHRNERPFKCQICNTSYGTNSSLKRHLKVSHTQSSEKPFECETCHRCFVSELIRDRHSAREHGTTGALEHACTKCTCRYLRLKDLQRHMYRIHPKGKNRRKENGE